MKLVFSSANYYKSFTGTKETPDIEFAALCEGQEAAEISGKLYVTDTRKYIHPVRPEWTTLTDDRAEDSRECASSCRAAIVTVACGLVGAGFIGYLIAFWAWRVFG